MNPLDRIVQLEGSGEQLDSEQHNNNERDTKTMITEIIIEAGRGAYGFTHNGARLYTTKAGRMFVIADRWCGRGSVEGECYRLHIGEISTKQADLLRSAARGERNGSALEILGDMEIKWARVDKANAAFAAIVRAAARH